jgi:hypothetical protein
MNAIVVKADPKQLRERRARALDAVHLGPEELRARVDDGTATPEEREAWEEVDTVDFLLAAGG